MPRHERGVKLEHGAAEQARERVAPDDAAGDRADERSHPCQVAVPGRDDRVRQVIGYVVAHRLVLEGGDGAVGERLAVQYRATRVRQHERQHRQRDREAAQDVRQPSGPGAGTSTARDIRLPIAAGRSPRHTVESCQQGEGRRDSSRAVHSGAVTRGPPGADTRVP